jgi:hypothetical protein
VAGNAIYNSKTAFHHEDGKYKMKKAQTQLRDFHNLGHRRIPVNAGLYSDHQSSSVQRSPKMDVLSL